MARVRYLKLRRRIYLHLLLLIGSLAFLLPSCKFENCGESKPFRGTEDSLLGSGPKAVTANDSLSANAEPSPGDKRSAEKRKAKKDTTFQERKYLPSEPAVDYGVPVYHLPGITE
jgi:hypothetical protein